MAQDKRVFTGGMDKDSDPRLIKNGDYRDALNIRNIASMDGTSGSVENIEGNTLVPFQFIDEIDQVIEFSSSTDGDIVVEEIPVEQVFMTQTILFSGKEQPGFRHTVNIKYFSATESSDGTLIPNGSVDATNQSGVVANPSWVGVESQLATAQKFLEVFGPGGVFETLTVQDYLTGNNINIKISSIVTSSGSDITNETAFNNNSPFQVTYRTEQANTNFLLDFASFGSQVTGQLWSDTVTDVFPNGNLWIATTPYEPSPSMVLGSFVDVDPIDDPVNNPNYNVDDEGNSYGFGLTETESGATIDLVVTGSEPTDNSTTVVNNVGIYTWDQIGGNGNSPNDFNVSELIAIPDKIDEFGPGGDYEFGNQQQFSEFLSDTVKGPEQGGDLGPVIVTGGSGLVTTLGSVTTNFLPNTVLDTERNTSSERNTDADQKSYNLLEYYYDDTEVVTASGFTIDKGVLTFEGDNIKGGELYLLRANVISGSSYKLTYTVSGMPSGNNFKFSIFDVESLGASSDGAKSSYITPLANSIYIAIKFANDFASGDSLTIDNLRLLLERKEVSNFKIRFQTTSSFDFNLAFATSAEQLKIDLARGNAQTKVNEWFPGVALELTKLTSGNQDVDVIDSFEYQDLQADLNQAILDNQNLQNEIESQQSAHEQQVAELQAAADADSVAAQEELDAANALNNTLTDEVDKLTSTIGNLETLIDQIDDPQSDTELIDVLAQYDDDKEEVQTSLQNIVSDLNNINSDLINNADLQSQLDSTKDDLNDAQTLISELNEDITEKDETITSLSTDLLVAETTLTGNDNLISSLEFQVGTLTNAQAASQSQLDSLIALNNSLQQTIDDRIDQFTSVTEGSISDLNNTLTDISTLIADTETDIIENSDGTFSSLTDKINELSDQITDLDSDLEEVSAGNTTANEELSNRIDELTTLNNQLSSQITEAQSSLNNIELTSDNPDFDLTSLNGQLDALVSSYSSLEGSFNSLSSTYEADVEASYADGFDAGAASINAEDGITQADVDAAFDAGVASVDVINVINEYNDVQPTPSVTEHIFENHFEIPITKWTGTNWNFEDSFAIVNKENYGTPGVLQQAVELREGNYILNLNIVDIFNCSFDVTFVSSEGNQTVKQENISSIGSNVFEIFLPFPCSRVLISVRDTNKTRFSASIDSISLTSVTHDGTATPGLVMELLSTIRQVRAANENLKIEAEKNRNTINRLEDALEVAREDLRAYIAAFTNTNNLINNLANVIVDVISDFSLSSSTTSVDVDNFVNEFNNNQNNLNAQISSQQSLISSLINLLNDVDGSSVPSEQVSNNEKWLFTFSGGMPVTNDFSDVFGANAAIIIKNNNIPDLGIRNGAPTNASNFDSNFGFLENSGFNFLRGFSNINVSRIGTSGADFDPETIMIKDINNLAGRLVYDNYLTDPNGELYDGNPNVFTVQFYSPSTEKIYTVRFTIHVNIKKTIVDTEGNQYIEGTSTGDKIVGDNGESRPIQVSTYYLENQQINDGFQVEVEFLGGETGWEMYYSLGEGLTPLSSSPTSTDVFVNQIQHNFNISNSNDETRQTTPNFRFHSEKLQEAVTSSPSVDTRGGVEEFVNALTMPSYSRDSFSAPEGYSYPSSSSDIIKNKSQNRKEKISSNLLGAKRFVKNKI